MQSAAEILSVAVKSVKVKDPEGLKPALSTRAGKKDQSLILLFGPMTCAYATQIAELARESGLPMITIWGSRRHQAGALMSWGVLYSPLLTKEAIDI